MSRMAEVERVFDGQNDRAIDHPAHCAPSTG